MKTNILSSTTISGALLVLVFLPFRAGVCQGQTPAAANAPDSSDYSVVQNGPHSRLWQNSAGQSVTEIATGMNVWNGQEWIPSDPSFVLSPDGTAFVAAKIQDPTQLAADLDCAGAVTVLTPQNVTLRSTPIAIGLYDAASGKSVIVAALTNTTGVLVDPQHVVYNKAFVGGGFAASVVYSLPDTGSFHQDVIFVGFDQGFDPTVWGFAADSTNTLQIQIFTEFYGAPQPRMVANPIYIEEDPVIRASMASPDLIDYALDFGNYVFWPGKAYTTASKGQAGGARVLKEFVTSSGRTFLVESIPYRWLAADLQALPPVVTRTSSLKHPPGAQKIRIAAASVPSLREIKKVGMEKILRAKTSALAVALPKGVTVDYVATVSTSSTPVVYSADTTYYVSGTVYDNAPVTIESAVFKFPTNAGIINICNNYAPTMGTTNYRPAIFTAADDNTIGTTLSTNIWSHYTGNPGTNIYGLTPLWLYAATNMALNNLQFRYQFNGVAAGYGSANQVITLSHCQFVDCLAGTTFEPSEPLTLNLNNCLFANVQYPVQSHSFPMTVNVCNCTFDSATDLFYADGSWGSSTTFNITNSILSNITNEFAINSSSAFASNGAYNGFYNATPFGSSSISVSSSPYQAVGAGNYYLSSASSFLTGGTTNIGSALLSQLQAKTVLPPLVISNCFTNNTVLTPVAQRDTTGPALGWHYDPIDYIAACSVSNATLLLTNGVALAYYDNLGIWLQDGSQLVSQGSPIQRNYLVYYGLVQEQPVNYWGATNAVAQSLPIAPCPYGSNANPSIFLRLTTICAPTGETNLLNTGDTCYPKQIISGLTLRDCEIYGAGANWLMSESNHAPVVGLTNNVFHRVPFAISNSATTTSFNNLFYGTTNTNAFTISIRHRGTNSPNTNQNNVFDGVTASLDGLVGYNAYLHGATNTTFQTNDIRTNLTWLGGPLGAYYQATNSPLINKGSTTADQLGLYQYTVTTNLINGLEIKETNSIVDLGYHYVAVNSNGIPICTSGDGIPDYLADTNGNNSGGTGSWTNYISPNGLTVPNGLVVFTPLK
jgi:hypothetical protein